MYVSKNKTSPQISRKKIMRERGNFQAVLPRDTFLTKLLEILKSRSLSNFSESLRTNLSRNST